jgi:hypothetical protein
MKRLRAVKKQTAGSNPTFKPGQTVPASGVYCLDHRQHELMHLVTLQINTLFPRCKRCGDAVRFTLLRRLKDGSVTPFRSTTFLDAYPEDAGFPKAS